ncbi:hypothetical protein ACP275_14G230500 [Erythranthe tilingii]
MRPNYKVLFFLVILFTISCFKLSCCATSGNINGGNISLVCPEIEREALLSFKASLEDPTNMLSTWNISADVNCCNWKGVVCSNITGGSHVHQLHLQNYNPRPPRSFGKPQGLIGKINPSLLNLKHLRYLNLSRNEFEETIPSFIGSITSLEYLDLSHAGFIGIIPHSIGNLSNLRTLRFEHHFYERSLGVDKLDWLSRLSQLEHLNMNYVNLSKASNWLQVINTLPSLVELRFGDCGLNFNNAPLNNNISTSLAILDLSGNYFEDPIPTISNSTKLQHIDLSFNNFNSIPDWLYSLKDLEFLDMSVNYLKGPLSNDIANLTALNTPRLFQNQLSGKIPSEITVNLCEMQALYLSGNSFQGDMSYSFGNMSDCFLGALKYLDMSDNQLSGQLTAQFGEFKSLETLYLGSNNLSGAIPINIGELSSLESLSLADNKLTENFPESVGKLSNLEYLYIDDNTLEGVVSEIHFANLTKLMGFSASGNHLTLNVSPNWIPPFRIETLRLGSWDLGEEGQIPTWIETQKLNVEDLDLSNTGISGIVPSWIWKITYLNISHNQLHGNIPIISDTAQIYLSSNRFTGSLPQIPANAAKIDFSNNSFSGGLSHFLCDKNQTYSSNFLHLGGNHLSGEIPDCWVKWPSMEYLNLGNNMLSGIIPNSIGFLTRLRSLNLYNNTISGRIPFSMRNCTTLVKIDLGNNDLDGSIPSWMGTGIADLKFLILRSNKLSGEISSHICHLNYLQILDLSDNRFSGILPLCVDNFTAMATKRNLSQYGSGELDFNVNNGSFERVQQSPQKEVSYSTTPFLDWSQISIFATTICLELSQRS